MKNKYINSNDRKYNIKATKGSVSKKINYEIKPRFYIVVGVIILILIILIVNSFKKNIVIDDSLNVTKLNISKYSAEIKTQYQKDSQKYKFINEYNIVQQGIGMYIMNNSTVDQNSYSDLIKNIRKELKKSDWSKLNMQKSTYWAGEWLVNDEGIVKFKFDNKNVEPSWIRDNDVLNMFE